MTSDIFNEILKSLTLLSLFLLLGLLLISKIKFFRYLYLPSSVVGGFIGLVVVQSGVFAIPQMWLSIYSLLPGILIIPIFASIPLGMKIDKNVTKSFFSSNIMKSFAIFMAASMMQSAIGYGTNIVFTKISPNLDLYRTFGFELSAGFSGGHGFASSLGKLLQGFGVAEWEIAQGIAMTTATVGLIGGLIFGIVFINIHMRKQNNKCSFSIDIDEPFYKTIENQESIGRQTFNSSSIETITFHLALILTVCGVSYIILDSIGKTNILALKYLPIWTYSMIIMFFVNIIIQKKKFDWAIDYKLKSRVMGVLTDFAIISAITSLPITAILKYTFPLLVMIILGFILTYIVIFQVSKIVFKNFSFERSIISWGAATGSLITGMTLLKICDNQYKTPALKDFSLGFSIMSITGLFVTPFLNAILATGSTILNLIVSLIFVLIYLLIVLLFNFNFLNKK